MKLRIASIAETDIVEAAQWLDGQQLGLGEDFLATIRQTYDEICQRPMAAPILSLANVSVKNALRWLKVGRFPYLVIFTIDVDEIFIVGVLNSHRDLDSILKMRVGTT